MVFRRLVLWTVMPLGSVANDRLRHMRIGYARVSKAGNRRTMDNFRTEGRLDYKGAEPGRPKWKSKITR